MGGNFFLISEKEAILKMSLGNPELEYNKKHYTIKLAWSYQKQINANEKFKKTTFHTN